MADSQISVPWDEVIGLALICTTVLTIAAAAGILILVMLEWVTLHGVVTSICLTTMGLVFTLLLLYFRSRLRG